LRSTLFGVVLAVTAVVATIVYGAGLTHFTSTPRLYGWVWDYQIESEGENPAPLLAAVERDPSVLASAVGYYSQPSIGGKQISAISVADVPGIPLASIVDGRAASAPDEVVLGAQTLRSIDHEIGATSVRGCADRLPDGGTVRHTEAERGRERQSV
jgi:hypothetical protein